MRAFEVAELVHARHAAGRAYLEFLRVPSLSCGIYAIPAGGADPQQTDLRLLVVFAPAETATTT
jgi:hypothetical protein